MDNIRTFIALEIPEDLRQALSTIQEGLKKKISGIKWVNPENIHITLKFLGLINVETQEEVSRILEQTSKDVSCFTLDVSDLGAFPSPRNPKVIWVGMDQNRNLWAFQKKLEEALLKLGFPLEKRPFSPHFTIGRIKDPKIKKDLMHILENYRNEYQGSYKASKVIFFRSDLHPEGPVYSVLKDINLS
jgi:2'-5' RNA ligase